LYFFNNKSTNFDLKKEYHFNVIFQPNAKLKSNETDLNPVNRILFFNAALYAFPAGILEHCFVRWDDVHCERRIGVADLKAFTPPETTLPDEKGDFDCFANWNQRQE